MKKEKKQKKISPKVTPVVASTASKVSETPKKKDPSVFGLLRPYGWLTAGLIVLGFATNGLNLFLPKIIAHGIDVYNTTGAILPSIAWEFFFLSFGIFFFAYAQSIAQTYVSEKAARDLRRDLINKIATQSYSYIQEVTAGKLLTNLTSDIDNIKGFVGQATVSIISSVFLVVGSGTMMLIIDWKLAIPVLAVLPFIGLLFFFTFSQMGPLFKKSQEIIDWLNKVINESILGAPVVRVLNAMPEERGKFSDANTKSRDLGIQITNYFAVIFPGIGFIVNIATLVILLLGGHFIITGSLTVGNFTAFVSYLGIIVFPIIMIGFLSSSISRASSSYSRIYDTLHAAERKESGTVIADLKGDIEFKDVSVRIEEKDILKDISFAVKAGTRTAILGPTAAGKTHLLYLLINIIVPSKGTIFYDDRAIADYDKTSLHKQVGFVFQDSIIFNMSVKENIAFNTSVTDADLERAIETAELRDFVDGLPQKMETIISERGSNLSGGQKQRIMLARALALNPRILLLDDFTARVDGQTEQKILSNIQKNYPNITLVSVTQKISSIEHFDQVVLLMEGEVLAKGTHKELMETSPEYVQIFDSQKSTTHYEI